MREARPVSKTKSSTLQSQLTQSLDPLDSVTLNELEAAMLHDRVESKVFLRTADLPGALARLSADYFALEHNGARVQSYRSNYFDSEDLRSYRDHHNKNGRRLKLRYRNYLDSDITFFELKRKVHGRTIKERQPSRCPGGGLWPEDASFVQDRTGWDGSTLRQSLTVDYRRILLVRHDFSERVTIDLDIAFASQDAAVEFAGLSICEFKQARLDLRSPAVQAMNRRPQSFSKYCIGLAACDPMLRRNRFKPIFRSLHKMGISTAPTLVTARHEGAA